MPRCYGVLLCQASSLDRYNNSWSLFHMTEALAVAGPTAPSPDTPLTVPHHLHVYWLFANDELDKTYQWRLLTVKDGSRVYTGQVFEIRSEKLRNRARVQGLALASEGKLELQVEYREKGAETWSTFSTLWPLDVSYVGTQLTAPDTATPPAESPK